MFDTTHYYGPHGLDMCRASMVGPSSSPFGRLAASRGDVKAQVLVRSFAGTLLDINITFQVADGLRSGRCVVFVSCGSVGGTFRCNSNL